MTKTVYKYNENNCYIGTDRAFESPLEKGIFHIPANCTEIKPPEEKEGFNIKWNGTAWEYEEIPQEPEPPEPTLDELKAKKLTEVNAWTESKITGGFISSCTGAPVRYDSDRDTQMTVQGDVGTIAQLPELFAENFPDGYPMRGHAEGSEEKEIFLLTIDQLNKWSADLSMHRGNSKKAGWEKQAEVMAAESESELDKIILD